MESSEQGEREQQTNPLQTEKSYEDPGPQNGQKGVASTDTSPNGPTPVSYPGSDSLSPSAHNSMADLLAYIRFHSNVDTRNRSQIQEEVEKASRTLYLTQKTSLKIAMLLDAITRKQSPLLRRVTGLVKPESEVLAFQKFLSRLQEQENLWSRVCLSTGVGSSGKFREQLNKHPDVLKAMGKPASISSSPFLFDICFASESPSPKTCKNWRKIRKGMKSRQECKFIYFTVEARTHLLRVDKDIRTQIVEPLKNNLIYNEKPDYALLHGRTEKLGDEALDVCRQICRHLICRHLISINPEMREMAEARRRENSTPAVATQWLSASVASNGNVGDKGRSKSVAIPEKLQRLSQKELLIAVSLL